MTGAQSEHGQNALSARGRAGWIGGGLAIALADQLSKIYVRQWLDSAGGLYEVTPFFNLHSVENTGAAFGLLAGGGAAGRVALSLVSLVFFIGLCAFVALYPRLDARQAAACALLLGGAAGNGIDRIASGRVYDFIDLHLLGWHWPAFNVADAAISVSVVMIIWQYWRLPAAAK